MKKIVPIREKATYLDSRIILARRGMLLATNPLHDGILSSPAAWAAFGHFYPCWARELLAYPEEDGRLRKGKDLIDRASGWVLPAEYMRQAGETKAVFGLMGVGLLLEPAYFEPCRKGRTAVHPGRILVLHGFLQNEESGKMGDSGIPLKADSRLIEELPESELRWLRRSFAPSVVPIVRGSLSGFDFGYGDIALPPCERPSQFANRYVFADYHPNSMLGMVGVATAASRISLPEAAGGLVEAGGMGKMDSGGLAPPAPRIL